MKSINTNDNRMWLVAALVAATDDQHHHHPHQYTYRNWILYRRRRKGTNAISIRQHRIISPTAMAGISNNKEQSVIVWFGCLITKNVSMGYGIKKKQTITSEN
jgi:hypothetical protein